MSDTSFWRNLDGLVAGCELVIDRPGGSRHPRYADLVYPIDYGYLAGTASADGGGIDVWRGSLPEQQVVGVICTLDLKKRDSEIKILLGCRPEEIDIILAFHNSGSQSGILIMRPEPR